MSFQEFCLLLVSVIAGVAGQVLLKMGATILGKVTFNNAITLVLNIVTIPQLIFGLACYGIGAVTYILLLTRVNLSVAAPSASLIYVCSVLVGHFWFRESIPLYRLFGMGFIICGVVLVVWQKKP